MLLCAGIAIPIYEIPDALIAKHRLADRIVHRDEGTAVKSNSCIGTRNGCCRCTLTISCESSNGAIARDNYHETDGAITNG